MRRADLADLTAFVAVANNLSFRAASERLGVTPSVLSHTIRHLEERVGVRLLQRTTRSVSLTDAGNRLVERVRPAMNEIAGALEDLDDKRHRFSGRLRIYATSIAAAAVIAPMWTRFLMTYPEVQLELEVRYGPLDILAKGFDAGIGPAEHAAAHMVAVRVMGPMKVAVVGAPSYFARRPAPRAPEDVAQHNCIQYRPGPPLQVGIRMQWQGTSDFRGWSGNCQRRRFRRARGRRWFGPRVRAGSTGRAVPALGAADARVGELVPSDQGTFSALSGSPADPGCIACAHRYGSHASSSKR